MTAEQIEEVCDEIEERMRADAEKGSPAIPVEEEYAITDSYELTLGERALLKRKLLKFACGTCDMGAGAPAQHAGALPRVAELLLTKF